MGKRSAFKRRPMDAYFTIDPDAVHPLLPFTEDIRTFAEPCAGDGHLVRHLERAGLECVYQADINGGHDALEAASFGRCDAIITNPPWTRHVLHEMIRRFQAIAPTWLLFDAAWSHTRQSAPFLDQCSHIVAVGRVRWIENTRHKGKDDVAWHRFHALHSGGPHFYGHRAREAA